MCIEIPVVNANRVDTNQTPHSAASDQDLHRLPMSLLWDVRYKLVKGKRYTFNSSNAVKLFGFYYEKEQMAFF